MSLPIPARLVPLDRLVKEHKALHEVADVDMDRPVPALMDGVEVRVTAILKRTAVYERPGRDIQGDGRELASHTDILINPDHLRWMAASAWGQSELGRRHALANRARRRPKGWRNSS